MSEPEQVDPLVDDILDGVDYHAKEFQCSFAVSLINHFIVSFHHIREIDPEVAIKLFAAIDLHIRKQISDDHFTQLIKRYSDELLVALPYFYEEKPKH